VTKPYKYLFIGLIVNVVILFIAGAALVVSIASSYKGRCGVFYFFGGQGRPCPLSEYMREELGFNLIALVSVLWWLILPAFLVIPVIGYFIGRHRNRYN
jgi:hypothetical protein